jgi:hypothetical protein
LTNLTLGALIRPLALEKPLKGQIFPSQGFSYKKPDRFHHGYEADAAKRFLLVWVVVHTAACRLSVIVQRSLE